MSPVNGQATATATPRSGDSDRRSGDSDRRPGGRLVATDGRALPLRGVTLRAEARGGLARVALHQRFANPHAEALRVTYLVPLPPDAALAGYAFRIGDRRIAGEVDSIADVADFAGMNV